MSKPFKAVRVSDHVYWVGAVDWGIRDFHGYLTERGTTYNAFLVMADKVTLIDTVKPPFLPELMARIGSVLDPKEISYIVSNHAEMDHSGSLLDVMGELFSDEISIAVADTEHYIYYRPSKRIDLKITGPMRPEYLRDLAAGTGTGEIAMLSVG